MILSKAINVVDTGHFLRKNTKSMDRQGGQNQRFVFPVFIAYTIKAVNPLNVINHKLILDKLAFLDYFFLNPSQPKYRMKNRRFGTGSLVSCVTSHFTSFAT